MSERVPITVLDNTLREGEQVPGLRFTLADKLALFDALEAAGVALVDVAIPVISEEHQEVCRRVVARASRAVPGASVRARPDELELAAALGFAEVYVMLPFSELHLEHKFGLSPAQVKARARELVALAGRLGLRVNLVAEDATRGSPELVCELAEAAASAGVLRLFLADTVGAALPSRLGALVDQVAGAVAGRCEIGFHGHDDLGLATANTLAAVEHGARVVSVTVNGLGERAGNAPMHEVLVALEALLGARHGVDLTRLPALSARAARMSGVFPSPLAAVVGRNAFRHESGIHVDGLLKDARVYEALRPEQVGRARELVLGAMSGAGYLRALLASRGRALDDDALARLRARVAAEMPRPDPAALAAVERALTAHDEAIGGLPLERFWAIVDELASEEEAG
jgi:homocitrate synthase NifV